MVQWLPLKTLSKRIVCSTPSTPKVPHLWAFFFRTTLCLCPPEFPFLALPGRGFSLSGLSASRFPSFDEVLSFGWLVAGFRYLSQGPSRDSSHVLSALYLPWLTLRYSPPMPHCWFLSGPLQVLPFGVLLCDRRAFFFLKPSVGVVFGCWLPCVFLCSNTIYFLELVRR